MLVKVCSIAKAALLLPKSAKRFGGKNFDRLTCRKGPREDIRDEIRLVFSKNSDSVINELGIDDGAITRNSDEARCTALIRCPEETAGYVVQRSSEAVHRLFGTECDYRIVRFVCRGRDNYATHCLSCVHSVQNPTEQVASSEVSQWLPR
jgi:hypothetical protein